MKIRTASLLALVLAAAVFLMAGCGREPASSDPYVPSFSYSDEDDIGDDWRSLRGYSAESYMFFGIETLISLNHGEDSLGYTFYDANDGSCVADLWLDTDLWTIDDMDQDRLWTLYEQDLNMDGLNEFGVPMKNDMVLWYQYISGRGFVEIGPGTVEGPEVPFPLCVGSGISDVYSLNDNGFNVRFSYFEDDFESGYYVSDENDEYYYGVIMLPASAEYADQQLDRSLDECFVFEDLDGDGVMEIGLPLINGSLMWFHYDAELEDFALYSEQVFAPEEEVAFDILMDALGDEMNGKALTYYGLDIVNGVSCCTFALGTNSPEKFTAEKHFAVDAEGNIYVCDPAYGLEYTPYNP